MKFTVELSDEDFTLLQEMAVREYRDVRLQAGWLIRCALHEDRETEAKRRLQEASNLIDMGMTPSEFRERVQAQRFIEATQAAFDDEGTP